MRQCVALSLMRPIRHKCTLSLVQHMWIWFCMRNCGLHTETSKWSGETHLHYPHSSAKHRLQPNGECRSIRWCRVRPSHRTLNSLQKKLFAQAAIFLHSQFDLCTFCGNSTAITRNSFLSRVCFFSSHFGCMCNQRALSMSSCRHVWPNRQFYFVFARNTLLEHAEPLSIQFNYQLCEYVASLF